VILGEFSGSKVQGFRDSRVQDIILSVLAIRGEKNFLMVSGALEESVGLPGDLKDSGQIYQSAEIRSFKLPEENLEC
jgi:hypothetical protein